MDELKAGDDLPVARVGEMPGRQGHRGFKTHGFTKGGDRLVQLTDLRECPAEVAMGRGESWG